MSFWAARGGLGVFEPSLPDHCEPANTFLHHLSSTFHICVPTPLALTSTLLGSLSILAWLFAQLPQIWKNYRLHSTSGLSIFFLGEWLLGDVSNLIGSIFTRQATWQVVLASYYCFVDIVLVCQWVWYGLLKHGRPLRTASSKSKEKRIPRGVSEIIDGVSVQATSDDTQSTSSKPIDAKRIHPSKYHNLFRTPQYASPPVSISPSSPSPSVVSSSTPRRPTILRPGTSPTPSPRTVLFITMLLAVLSRASPHHLSTPIITQPDDQHPQTPTSQLIGQLFSWLSTFSYLGSRLPQLYKNHTRRSTSGLSPILFLAAFTGNLFYATSLLTNPCAWHTFGPHGGRGWVGREGSDRNEWVGLALPFFLGAAGCLMMDGMIGVQFWMFGEGKAQYADADGEEVASVVQEPLGAEEEELEFDRRWRWRRVDGWMRGWVPSVSVAGTPMGSGTPRPASLVRGEGERDGLLRREEDRSKVYGAVGG